MLQGSKKGLADGRTIIELVYQIGLTNFSGIISVVQVIPLVFF
jgi:hypothetical protein